MGVRVADRGKQLRADYDRAVRRFERLACADTQGASTCRLTLTAQLGFQKSAYSDGQESRFTVNLSVIRRDEWATRASAKPYLGQRPTPDCALRLLGPTRRG